MDATYTSDDDGDGDGSDSDGDNDDDDDDCGGCGGLNVCALAETLSAPGKYCTSSARGMDETIV